MGRGYLMMVVSICHEIEGGLPSDCTGILRVDTVDGVGGAINAIRLPILLGVAVQDYGYKSTPSRAEQRFFPCLTGLSVCQQRRSPHKVVAGLVVSRAARK